MAALEVKKLKQGTRLCETCLAVEGPSRQGVFAVYLLGYPADECCSVHAKAWRALFATEETEAA